MRKGGVECCDVLLKVPVRDAAQAMRTHAACSVWIVEDAVQRSGKGVNITYREDASLNAITDEVWLAADVVRDDHWTSSVHYLIHDEAPRLVLRGKNEDVCQIEEAWQLGLVAKATEADAFSTRALFFEAGAFLTVTDYLKVGRSARSAVPLGAEATVGGE